MREVQLQPIGLVALIEELGLDVDPPATTCNAGPTSRRTVHLLTGVQETYPQHYLCSTALEHIRFALRYEPLDLSVWQHVMAAVPVETLETWIRSQPTGAYARRAWYLYEALTGRTLDIPDVHQPPYCELADDTLQFTWSGSDEVHASLSRRHRVRNNLLGPIGYCPLVRRTPHLEQQFRRSWPERIGQITHRAETDPRLFQRAAQFLYLNETKSSYAIEGEKPSPDREGRFVDLLDKAGAVPVESEADLVALQQLIVQDKRFTAQGWRTVQNWVGQTRPDYTEAVHYVCPKPGDVPVLMGGWSEFVRRIHRSTACDPVVLAACASFGFVYVHPFEDGNGRLHRFLVHHVLSNRSYSPPGVIFPVSAPILRRRKDYDALLESLGRPMLRRIGWEIDFAQRMTVQNETIGLYRYPDLTRHAEFLYECIEETVEKDWPEQIRFLEAFDGATRAVQAVVDMPDTKIRLLVKLLMQNEGKLSASKRGLFAFLTDDEVARIENDVGPILNPPEAAVVAGADAQ
ncbi:MAG: Fic family protein [Bryobacteraceae bacterium]